MTASAESSLPDKRRVMAVVQRFGPARARTQFGDEIVTHVLTRGVGDEARPAPTADCACGCGGHGHPLARPKTTLADIARDLQGAAVQMRRTVDAATRYTGPQRPRAAAEAVTFPAATADQHGEAARRGRLVMPAGTTPERHGAAAAQVALMRRDTSPVRRMAEAYRNFWRRKA